MRKKIHFTTIELGNESNPEDEYGKLICGTQSDEPETSNKWGYVSCKKCLKIRERFELEMLQAFKHNCSDMEKFNEFVKQVSKN